MDVIQKAKEFYRGELLDRNLYRELSYLVKDEDLKENLIRISKTEEKHSNFWKKFLEKRAVEVEDNLEEPIKLKFIKFLAKFINPIYLISILESGETSALKSYYDFLNSTELDEYESKSLKMIILDEFEHETYFEKVSEKLGLNNVRDVILGMNDGLVEIMGTVAGLTAVYQNNPQIIGVSGLVVGIAGALSMGIGAFVSVRSQKQVNEALEFKQKILLKVDPQKSYDLIDEIIPDLPQDIKEKFIETVKKYKIDIGSLLVKSNKENEYRSGIFTGLSYLLGVFFPVIPFFFSSSSYIALPLSILFSLLVISLVSGVVSIFSGIPIKKKIFEMVTASSIAALLSFSFGKIVQTLFNIEI
ncbi:MAG: VIT1/CCC1 transporter family protein [Hydrogenothermaceae bacterium]|nr:VIT1/CCC1 transporter family protein [Hydrogenothermaceae bacterium]